MSNYEAQIRLFENNNSSLDCYPHDDGFSGSTKKVAFNKAFNYAMAHFADVPFKINVHNANHENRTCVMSAIIEQ